MFGRRHEDDSLAVFDGSGREPANGAIQKRLILIQLHDVIARPRGS
jgi:hypothetical protein